MGNDNEEVVIPIKLDIQDSPSSLTSIKKQIEAIKQQYEKAADELSRDFNPLGRSKANKDIGKRIQELKGVGVELDVILKKINDTEMINRASEGVKNTVKTQLQLLQEIYRLNYAIAKSQKELNNSVRFENEAKNEILRFEQEIAALNKEQTELARKSGRTAEEESRLDAILDEKMILQEELKLVQKGLAEQESITQSIRDRIAAGKEAIRENDTLVKSEEAYSQYVRDNSKEENNQVRFMQEVVNETNKILSNAGQILGVNKQNNQVVKDTTAAMRAQNQTGGQVKTQKEKTNDNFGGNFLRRQTYYNLRQIRLVQSELDRISANTDKVQKTFTKTIKTMLKSVTTLALGFTNLRKATDKTKKSHDNFGKSLLNNFWTFMKYAFGIRTMVALMSRLRTALSTGMQNLALYSDYVNGQMSSVVTSLLQMKNAIATAVQPMLNVLAPALEYVANKVADLTFNIAQLVASLTGQTFVYKAKRAQVNYAESLNKSAEAASKLNKELAEYDKLEVISKDNDTSDGMPDPSEMFETVSPISDFIKDIADKIKNLAEQFFAPIKAAWESEGKYVMESWKYALDEVWGLIKDIGRDFLIMWNEDATIQMWETIFHIVGDIGQIIGNIANNLDDAWNKNKEGLKIWENLRDIAKILLDHVHNITEYMVEWSSSLNFSPLLEAFNNLLNAMKKVADFIGGIFEDVMENVVLKYIKWLVETGIPNFQNAMSEVLNNFPWDELRNKLQPLWDAIEHLMEVSFAGLSQSIVDLTASVGNFTQTQEFNDFITNITKFINKIKPETITKLFDALYQAFLNIASTFLRFFNSSLVQGFLNFLLDFINNSSTKDIADIITLIAGSILGFKFTTFLGKSFLKFKEFITILEGFATGGKLASAAGGIEGVATSLGNVALGIGQIALAMADIKAFIEFMEMLKDYNNNHVIPTTADDTNGYTREVDGLLGKAIDVNNAIREVLGLDPISKDVVVKSDLEKLDEMNTDLAQMRNNMWMLGLDTDDVNKKIEDAFNIWNDNGKTFEGMSSNLLEDYTNLYKYVRTYYDEVTKTQDPEKAIENLSKKYQGLVENMPNEIDGQNVGKSVIEGLTNGIKTTIIATNPALQIIAIAKAVREGLKINSPSKVFEDIGSGVIEGFRNGLRDSWTLITSTLKSKLDNLKSTFKQTLDTVSTNWKTSFENIRTNTTTILDKLKSGIKSPINGIISGIERMINGIINAFNKLGDVLSNLHFDVPDWVPVIGGNSLSINLPRLNTISIPKLAQGAVIPPNKEFMAMLGDQKQGVNIETPLETMKQAFKEALEESDYISGSNQSPIVLQLNGKTIAQVVWDETDKRYKQTGRYIPSYA